jgi:hypothetical protein
VALFSRLSLPLILRIRRGKALFMTIRTCLGMIFLALLVARTDAAGRLPVPNPAEEASLRESIRNQYIDQYTNLTDRSAQMGLARQLWQASITAPTPAEGYALLCEARDIAARTGDLSAALGVADLLSAKYAVSVSSARVGAFATAGDVIQGSSAVDAYFRLLIAAIDQAMQADDFTPAHRLIQTAGTVVSAQQAYIWAEALSTRQTDLKMQESAFASIALDFKHLRENPSDPNANLIIGRYECLIKGDWTTGLPMLERCSDEFLQKSARIELAEPENLRQQRDAQWFDGKPQTKVADSWASLEDIAPEYQTQLRLHIYDWYLRGLPLIPESDYEIRGQVEQQLQKLLPIVEGHRPNASMFVSIAESLTHHTVRPTAIVGGRMATEKFRDAPQGVGVLVGFHLGLALLNGQQVITYVQPIYSTPAGEQEGTALGRLFSKPQTVRAPAGYAVGALKIAGDRGINSVTFAFMRIEGSHLSQSDRLAPIRIGGNGGTEQVIDSMGEPIVGIVGKQRDGFVGLGASFKVGVKKEP